MRNGSGSGSPSSIGGTAYSRLDVSAPPSPDKATITMAPPEARSPFGLWEPKRRLAGIVMIVVMVFLVLRSDLELLEATGPVDAAFALAQVLTAGTSSDDGPTGEAVFKALAKLADFELLASRDTAGPPALPRSSEREYNAIMPGQRYFLYTPSGGFNNQLICLLTAMKLAREFNRTLIVPQNGRHRNFYWRYYNLTQEELVPMDQSLDLQYMESASGVAMVPLNVTIRSFVADVLGEPLNEPNKFKVQLKSARVDLVHLNEDGLTKGSLTYHKEIYARLQGSDKEVLWIHGRFFTHRWEEPNLRRQVRFAPFLRAFSRAISDELFGEGVPFNAIHVRTGDKLKRLGQSSHNAATFIRKARGTGFDAETPVYLATDGDPRDRYFKPARKFFHKIVFQGDLAKNEAIQKWLLRFHKGLRSDAIRFDLFGLVEQLVCVRAKRFVGSLHSTFSKTISRQRVNLKNALPDLWATISPEDAPPRGSILVTFQGKSGFSQLNEHKILFPNHTLAPRGPKENEAAEEADAESVSPEATHRRAAVPAR